jgi:hypothetical protein
MSISSSNYADYAERVRERWATELQAAVDARDWDLVRAFLSKLSTPTFSE